MLVTVAQQFRDALIPFLLYGTALLALLLAILIVQRLIRAAVGSRRGTLLAHYEPLIEAVVAGRAGDPVIPSRHRRIVGDQLLTQLRILRGPSADRAAAFANRLGLVKLWREDLDERRWWRRAEAALALGLVRDRTSVRALMARLDDQHEQVRAAAIDALGQIRDTLSVPALLRRMSSPARHEHARIVEALRAFGERAADALIEHGRSHDSDRVAVAKILLFVGGTSAADTLLEWTAARDPALREAAWSALSKIGVDARAFYHAVKALTAAEPGVRSAAARALARSGRTDAAPYLLTRLDDEWEVAAHSARALARLGPSGIEALQARLDGGDGPGRDLARQVLWETGPR